MCGGDLHLLHSNDAEAILSRTTSATVHSKLPELNTPELPPQTSRNHRGFLPAASLPALTLSYGQAESRLCSQRRTFNSPPEAAVEIVRGPGILVEYGEPGRGQWRSPPSQCLLRRETKPNSEHKLVSGLSGRVQRMEGGPSGRKRIAAEWT